MNVNRLSMRRPAIWLTLMALVMMAGSASAADTWKADPAHSMVGFTVRHMVSKVQGRFDTYTATIVMDGKDLKTAVATADIDAASINTQIAARDKHLRSGDFFGVDSFPKITFKSTAVKPRTADTGVLQGLLTMHGVTRPVELQYTLDGFVTDPWGGERAGFEATGTLNRQDFGIKWNKALDNVGVLVSDQVTLNITVEMVKEKPAPPAGK